ncbi:hypothetical protein [uncultured Corynebacterium sp.]|uniref:hypothetical protein n=1 Tax=uncultured Corynebacterium sp. TaxID=159447 RepID=UPI0025953D02|nr:hypothetical protein [uncultured Corynebacterium sp.]
MTHTSNLRKGATRVHASAATAMVLTAGLTGGARTTSQQATPVRQSTASAPST